MSYFNPRYFSAFGIIVALTATSLPAMAATDTDKDGVPDAAEPVLGTDQLNPDTDGDGLNDLADKAPLNAENPIVQTGKANGFTFTAKVEDNFDPATKKDVSDHLELEVKNISGEALTNMSMYYTLKDDVTGKTEAYFKPLVGLVINKGETMSVNLDDTGMPGHYRENPNSAYHKSENGKVFTVQLAAAGYTPVQIEFKKDKGGAEKAD
jgi:hypothetical protein